MPSPITFTNVPGNRAVLTVIFTNEAGAPQNPTAVTFTVKTPTQTRNKLPGSAQTFGQAGSTITNTAVGTFRLEVSETEGGNWWAEAVGTGVIEAVVEGTWYVDPGRF